MDMNMTIEGEPVTMAMSMDHFDFGIDVNVQAPPARDVFDATACCGRRPGRALEPTTGSPTLSRVQETLSVPNEVAAELAEWATAARRAARAPVPHAAAAREPADDRG